MSAGGATLRQVLSDTTRIIKAHSRHFLALSMVFLFPISFSTFIYTSLLHPTSIHSYYRRSLYIFSTPNPNPNHSPLLLQIIYSLFVSILYICATASISYSTFHGFYGRPVKFISSLKSILFSFFPLLATVIVMQIIFVLIIFAFIILMLLTYNGLLLIGIEFDYDTVYFLVFVILIVALLVGVLIYLESEWYVSNVVVVLESQWGFSPLRRSSYLVKGMKRVVFCMILLFGVFGAYFSFLCLSSGPKAGILEGWFNWKVVLKMVLYTCFLTILSLYSVSANTVLFIHCKALHGEFAFEIDHEEFAQEYVSLPREDGNVPYVVNVV
ncbi:hypothetical protein BUALT_Bualt17G0075600 [Buddleja alternifolia]|uniref:Uncharacterized protein n=1 Tax=Buddleja alternifolia TaxID=168488 RepID=A0AAV6W8I3_9LAMI|nr:hypothetical protein BUALT_Bualt17G0075600 [Buddleja alternifolia]